jgi:hypothetical protein
VDRGRPTRTYSFALVRGGSKLAGGLQVVLDGPVSYSVNAIVPEGPTARDEVQKALARVRIGDSR